MKKKQDQPADAAELRRRAEERLKRRRAEDGGQPTALEAARLVHELHIHQIELETQNEELRQAHDHAETLLAQYTDLYDFAPAGYLTLDREGAIRQVNLTGASLLGVERSRLVNRRLSLFVAEGDRRAFSDFLQRVFASDARESCEVTLPQAGLHPHFVRIEGTRSEDGQECRMVVISLTESKRAEDALRESEEQFRAIFQMASIGMAQADVRTGQWLRVNRKMCEITGYSADEMVALHLSEITHPQDRERDWEAFKRVVRGEAPSYRMEKRYVRKDGTQIWVNVNMTIIRDPAGEPLRTIATIEDITERKRADETMRRLLDDMEASRRVLLSVAEDEKEAETEVRQLNAELEQRVRDRTVELEAANRELEAFSYSVSHDLRAPLRAVIGYARILSDDHASQLDAEGQRVLGVVCAEALRMGKLIDDLLDFSRLGRQPLRKAPTDVIALVREVYADVAGRAPDRPIDFHLGALPVAPADRALLRQVWFNLLDNAVKFTCHRERAEIAVAGSVAAGEVVYSVKDNGAGFDMKYADKLFGVFQRLHRAEEFDGTGVGLALVKRLVLRHGGRVWAEAEPDRGATFYFTLPLTAAPVGAKRESASGGILLDGERMQRN